MKRAHRFPRVSEFTPTRKNLLVWTIGGAIALFLLLGLVEIAICAVEEVNKPERICFRCAINSGQSVEGDEFWAIVPNRTCPVCGRVWGDYRPYYWKPLRDPIRREFGIVHF
jgi:hypothetical protein